MSAPEPALRLKLFGRRRPRVQLQAEAAECGLACLATILCYYGHDCDIATLRRRHPVSMRGLSLATLVDIARSSGLSPRALRLDPDELRQLRLPAILHWNLDHFVVLEKAHARGAIILDPATGRQSIGLEEISRRFTGVALELRPAGSFKRASRKSRLHLSAFLANTRGLGAALFQLLALSAALQVFLLATPFYSQLVIDDIVISGDTDLLLLAALTFSALALFVALTAAFRAWLIVYIGATLNLNWSSALFEHLLRLPFSYFEKRHVGDIQSRFGSLTAVRELVTTQVVEAIIDGLMAVTTAIVMLIYSPMLAAIVAVSVLFHGIVRWIAFAPLQSASRQFLVRSAAQDGFFLETLRGIVAIRNFGHEAERTLLFEGFLSASISADASTQRIGILAGFFTRLGFGLQNVAVVWLGAVQIINGQFSVGMLVAFVAYQSQFAARAAALLDRLFRFRLVRIHLDRLADILETRPEPRIETPAAAVAGGKAANLAGSIAARNLGFRYSPHEARVFANQDFAIEAGDHVAIAGASGAGKSTLLKVLTGLLEPDCGEVLVDGQALQAIDLAAYRRQIGIVMQNDRLLSGSIIDNVGFFATDIDPARVDECCRIAGIRDEIRRMPMGFYTRVGDMGATLSGGQQQRLLLARALYREPKMLFLDEASSHLDADNERHLVREIAALSITRVIVAHREETLRYADRIITLQPHRGDAARS